MNIFLAIIILLGILLPIPATQEMLLPDLCSSNVILCQDEIENAKEVANFAKFEAIITAYTASKEETDENPDLNAMGKKPQIGDIACPRKYPFGTKVIIDDIIYTCTDRMAEKFRDGNYFDILMLNRQSAINFGRQIKKVKIWMN